MTLSFKARIYKVGINPVVKVPLSITKELEATKGYIPVKGTINGFFFQQTLCPVKNDKYRLYVNAPMLKGASVKNGQTAFFVLEQDSLERNKNIPMPDAFKKALQEHNLLTAFKQLSPSRQKEVNRYLLHIKTEAALQKNIDKIIKVLQGKAVSPLFRIQS